MDEDHLLPNDLAQCQQLLLAAFRQAQALQQRVTDGDRQVAELQRVLDHTEASYATLQETHQAMLAELARLKRWIYGRRSERVAESEGQRHLFDLQPPSQCEPKADPAGTPVQAHARRRHRQLDLDQLPHYRHEVPLTEEEKQCTGCGRAKDRIGEDETKILDYVPPKLEVHVHVRPKYACRYCKDGVTSPAPPPRPIARGIAGPGLIAQIVVAKFGDHLPLYRQEDFFARCGLHLARSTQCDWVRAAADLFQPLADRMKQLVLQSPVLWTDDTTVKLLTGDEQGSRTARFWTYIAEEHPYTVYDFTDNRSRAGPARFLQGFTGYLHADAYTGYDSIYLDSDNRILEVACWAHARRKFFDTQSSAPRPSHQILEWIGQLYAIEHRATDLSVAARTELRQREARPILDRMESYLAELARRSLPKSEIAKATAYARNQWPALRRYTDDGRLTIDNNVSERTLRHQAVGRKNWIFIGAPEAGPRAAVLYTILASAKRHHIEPWAYLKDLLLKLHAEDTPLDELLPDRWLVKHPDARLDYRLAEKRRKAAAKRLRRQKRSQAKRRK